MPLKNLECILNMFITRGLVHFCWDKKNNCTVFPFCFYTRSGGTVPLTPAMVVKAQKYCRWAVSALEYEDGKTAVVNLQKALTLLTTGRDT